MIPAIPKPPEALAYMAGAVFVIFSLSCIGVWVMEWFESCASAGQRRAAAISVFVGVPSACLLILLWAALAHAGIRTLSWTMPTTTARANTEGRLVDCAGGDSTRSLAGWRIYAQIQSPTWVREGSAMLRDEARYAALWARVGNEALPRQVKSASSKHLPGNGRGMRMSTTVPDSLDGQPVLLWFVEIFNDSGKVSCPSNLKAARP